MHIRDAPTVPADRSNHSVPCKDALDDTKAVVLPTKHCAFSGCAWDGSTDKQLYAHVKEKHWDVLQEAQSFFPKCFSESERLSAVYNEAVAEKIRCGAPLAAYSIDRRCLRNYHNATRDDQIEAPICFFCACVYTRSATCKLQDIEWCKPLENPQFFLGCTAEKTRELYSLDTYLRKYGTGDANSPNLLRRREEFDDWTLDVPVDGDKVEVLCCPEDRRCEKPGCSNGRAMCHECEVPVCRDGRK